MATDQKAARRLSSSRVESIARLTIRGIKKISWTTEEMRNMLAPPRGCSDNQPVRAAGSPESQVLCMKLLSFFLLLSGWGIVLSALALLPSPASRAAFALAGFAVELLGLLFVFLGHRVPRGN
jgi:hypothetical protein